MNNENKLHNSKVPLTMNVLFSGIGAQERGFENSGLFDVKVLTTSDINKEAVLSYAAIHCGLTQKMVDNYTDYPPREEMAQYLTDINLGYEPEKDKRYDWFKLARRKKNDIEKYWLACKLTNNLGDISKIKELPYADLWTVSFCCFVEGTLVLTNNGYKKIEEIEVGDSVLTHNNSWQKVLKTMTNEANTLYKIKTMPSEDIHCTPNHPFYVRKRNNMQDSKTGRRWREFDTPVWIEAKDLSREYYVGTAINAKEELPEWEGIEKKVGSPSFGQKTYIENRLKDQFKLKDFWYIIGRYLGDGWIRSQGGIIICANDQELHQITPYLERLGWGYSIVKNRDLNNIHIPFKEIGEYCLRFGRGASNKRLTSDILNLPTDLLGSFTEGYIAADGTQGKNGLYRITSVSRELIYELGQCVAKVYHRPFSVYFTQRPKTTVIEGRIVNQRDTYSIHFKLDNNVQDKAFYENGYIWSPINEITEEEYNGLVYNLEVENDNSYVVQNIIVHNCQDISVAGKMKGLSPDSGTRSSLLWENIRLLKQSVEDDKSPKYIMFENVKNLVSKKFINDFNNLIEVLDELGFNTYWKVINGKDCGVPQNRERVFAFAIRKDIDTGRMDFPKPFDNGVRLKDILEESVDEKYYLSDEVVKRFKITDNTFRKNIIGTTKPNYRTIGQRDVVYQQDSIMGALVATDYKQPKQIIDTASLEQVGQIYGTEKEPNPQTGRIYNSECLSPTLDTCSGGNRMPKILQRPRGFNKGGEFEECPSITSHSWETNNAVSDNIRIRKLTPKECWRLMGFEDIDCENAAKIGVSDSQLYRQAGNSIITNCVELLAEHLYKAQYDNDFVCYDENFTQPRTD